MISDPKRILKQQLKNDKISNLCAQLIIAQTLKTFETRNEMTNNEIKHAITKTR